MDIKNKYINTLNRINELQTGKQTIKGELDDLNPKLKNKLQLLMKAKKEDHQKELNAYEEISERVTALETKKEELEIQEKILKNNLLSIEQDLLYEGIEIYQNSKYFKKALGEKTKEKINSLISETIKEKYNIDVYTYINSEYNYSNEQIIKLSLYYSDFYYEYELKNESIHYNINKNLIDLYYYSKIEFINIEETEEEAKRILKEYKINYNKIQDLYKQIECIKNENNKNAKGLLNSYYLSCYLNWR